MSRRLVYVMGPSGAGKDSVLDWLRAQLPPGLPLHWTRRTITRPAQAGGEQHEALDAAGFARGAAARDFALSWQANGLHYGVRWAELAPLDQGHWVLVNGSRAHWPEAAARFPLAVGVHITASAETLRLRLAARGRETAAQIEARLQRAPRLPQAAAIEIGNDGTLEQAGLRLLGALQALPGWPVPQPAA